MTGDDLKDFVDRELFPYLKIFKSSAESSATIQSIGKSSRKISLWQRLRDRQTLVERLIAECRGISVIVLDTMGEKDLLL